MCYHWQVQSTYTFTNFNNNNKEQLKKFVFQTPTRETDNDTNLSECFRFETKNQKLQFYKVQ